MTPNVRRPGGALDAPVVVAFVHEQHLGHRTYADNLRSASASRDDVVVHWVPVDYSSGTSWIERFPLPGAVSAALAGRRQVVAGLRRRPAHIDVFNTQVPAVLAGTAARRRPYVLITDVTPLQYDAMAEGYGHRPDRPGPLRWWKHRANRRAFQAAAACVGWSSWAASSFVDDYGVDPARTVVIPPGVDVGTWAPAAGDGHQGTRILFVGGQFERKGGDLLIEALGSLPDDVELHVVTKSDLPDSGRVRVYRDLAPNDPKLIALYRTSDVFAIPSRAETFGIAAVEASAAGLPVVATSVGGFADIVVDGETGLLVAPGDGRALVAALRAMVDDADQRRRMGGAARQRALERFDATQNAGRLFDLARATAAPTCIE